MTQKLAALVLASVVLAGVGALQWTVAAPAPKLTQTEKDLCNLQGEWTLVTAVVQGEQRGGDEVLVFERNKFSLTSKGRVISQLKWQGTFEIDASQEPRSIDMTITKERIARGEYEGMVALGIYELEDGTLKWTVADPIVQQRQRGPAPPKFGPWPPFRPAKYDPKDVSQILWTFKRSKP